MKRAFLLVVSLCAATPTLSQTRGEGVFVEAVQDHFAAGIACQSMGLSANIFDPKVEVLEAKVDVQNGGVALDAIVRESEDGPELTVLLSIDQDQGIIFVCEYLVVASTEDTQTAWDTLTASIGIVGAEETGGVIDTTVEPELMDITQCTYAYDVGLEWVAHIVTTYIRDADDTLFSSVSMVISDQYPPCQPEPL